MRVPRQDGTLFARPPLSDVPDAAQRNRSLLDTARLRIQGRTLTQLREWTRRETLRLAQEYTAEITGEPVAAAGEGPWFCSGHQPSLYHPGVWIKNFAISQLARQCGGVALNLVVDNDTLNSTRIKVPGGTPEQPSFETLSFDEDRPPLPWENARLLDRSTFAAFAEQVRRRMEEWGIDPLLDANWSDAVQTADATGSLRDALTAFRARLERRWGCGNLELPLSRLCDTEPFWWFASHVLAHRERFRELHNDVLAEYRRVNRVRSRTHPVPELTREDDWTETPFWMWRPGDRRRRRLFARQDGRTVVLSDGSDVFARLPLTEDMDACCAVEALRELPSRGICLRTRALTTTLFARLCLADLFVHGIGGAKYDEMTDRLMMRFFGLPAPEFLTLSCTVQLPLAAADGNAPDDVHLLASRLRELTYNPERFLTNATDSETTALLAEKRELIRRQQRREDRRENRSRFLRIRDINACLAERVRDQRERTEAELASARQSLAAHAILTSREFPFVLYPQEKLRPFLTHTLP